MPYLSLASVINEMNGAEADARRGIDVSFEPLRAGEEKPKPKLDKENKPAGQQDSAAGFDIMQFLRTGNGAKAKQ